MLEGTLADDVLDSSTRDQLAAYLHPCRLLVKPAKSARFRLAIDRSQPFTSQERDLAGQFIRELAFVSALPASEYEADLLQAIPRRVVSKHVGGGAVLSEILERFESWSSRTYEGQRIVASIGVTPDESTSEVRLAELWEQDFGPVLTNGFDTLIAVDSSGRITEFHPLSTTTSVHTAPYRLQQVASWAEDGRIAVVLNRHGEVLVFRDRSLQFARRRGRWIHYVHRANIKRMSPPRDPLLREAMYESCLDVSYARSGGCLGIIDSSHTKGLSALVANQDLLKSPSSYKARLISQAINGKRFQHLDRRLRLELLSMDGAVIVNHQGVLLAAGAIIEVPAGSAGGGGRQAAARKLSFVGLGVKISEDGTITGFRKGKPVFVT